MKTDHHPHTPATTLCELEPAAAAHTVSFGRRDFLALALAGSALPVAAPSAEANAPPASAPVATAGAAGARAADPPFLPLWPAGLPEPVPPLLQEEIVERAAPGAALRDRIARRITAPGVLLVPAPRPDGSAVLIIPGGAYQHVVIDKEGLEIAEWMAVRGTTAAVLRYRLPGDGWASGPDVALLDAQCALQLLRSLATSHAFDAARVGVIGCSAGGHLAARLLTEASAARPDFGALLYPVIAVDGPYAHAVSAERLLGSDRTAARIERYSPVRHVSATTPPTWLLHAGDDTAVPLQNSLDFHAALRAQRVPTELHVYESGGHGFGLRFTVGKPVSAWPLALRAWAAQHGFMSPTVT
jgi:acetyl esterase/lipase